MFSIVYHAACPGDSSIFNAVVLIGIYGDLLTIIDFLSTERNPLVLFQIAFTGSFELVPFVNLLMSTRLAFSPETVSTDCLMSMVNLHILRVIVNGR